MDLKTLKTIPLNNGLLLHLLDGSKQIAGDRWYVSVRAQIAIPVTEEIIGDINKTKIRIDDLRDVVGQTITFEKKMERNFISEAEKHTIMDGFITSFLQLAATYLNHPDFAKNYILKVFKEKQMQNTWYK